MSILFNATARHFAEAQIGATHVPADTDVVAHFISVSAEELEARINAYLLDPIAGANYYVYSLHITGSGDGGKFCVTLCYGSDQYGGIVPAPLTADAEGSAVFFYKGETEYELQQQYLQARARMRDWLEEGDATMGSYVDYQIAGAAQGQVQMGMIYLTRFEPPP